ncbi:MAG: signal peptidase I [Patescibacteria group bacterium]|nr:signal peptidase I [Patescibacteria group bacterium]
MKKFLTFIWETMKMLIVSLAIILPIRYFLAEPFYVKGASMEPNFHDHEYLIIDRLNYRFNEPKRGDPVVFRYPNDPREYFIKRLIGLPGETVEVKDGGIYIFNTEHKDGWKLPEEYLPNGLITISSNPAYAKYELGPDQYYFLGDNRNASMDSRVFGPVNKSFIIGRVIFRGLPVDKFGKIEGFNYSQ